MWSRIDESFEEGVQKYRRKSSQVKKFNRKKTTAILDLMRRMLVFQPEERPTAEEVLESKWMVKWVLPSLNMSMETK